MDLFERACQFLRTRLLFGLILLYTLMYCSILLIFQKIETSTTVKTVVVFIANNFLVAPIGFIRTIRAAINHGVGSLLDLAHVIMQAARICWLFLKLLSVLVYLIVRT